MINVVYPQASITKIGYKLLKKATVLTGFLLCVNSLWAQEADTKNTTSFKPGNGLTFDLNNGDYQFFIGGFIQPSLTLETTEGVNGLESDTQSRFNARRSFFMLGGTAAKEKISFLLQTDFSLRDPLQDAWVAYTPYKWLTISVGQKQNFVNNREMLYREDRLQFADRSLSSRTFSRTGREFGLFLESKFGEKIGIVPRFSITSGDGRNSFGADSRDVDYGGTKMGGRLDIYPLGYFKEGNDLYTADLMREETPKILVGAAASRNNGASDRVGEGHGTFLMYNNLGRVSLPDYNQVFADILVKYQGFSMLLEYSNAAAGNLSGLYINEGATTLLRPTQISEFLILGNSYTAQLGYVTKKGLSFDARFEQVQPEFDLNPNSLLSEFTNYTFGVTKYFDKNNLKIQAAVTQTDFANRANVTTFEFLTQIAF